MKRFFIFLIRIYQYAISPFLGSNCRFYPSCSHYAVEAFEGLPWYKAFFKTTWRLLRCHPWSEGGLDPVISDSDNDTRLDRS